MMPVKKLTGIMRLFRWKTMSGRCQLSRLTVDSAVPRHTACVLIQRPIKNHSVALRDWLSRPLQ